MKKIESIIQFIGLPFGKSSWLYLLDTSTQIPRVDDEDEDETLDRCFSYPSCGHTITHRHRDTEMFAQTNEGMNLTQVEMTRHSLYLFNKKREEVVGRKRREY